MQAAIYADKAVEENKLEAVVFAVETIGRHLPRLGGFAVVVTRAELDRQLPRVNRRQVDSAIVETGTPWSDRSFTAFVTANDLGASDVNVGFCYGRARNAGGNIIISAARLEQTDMLGLTLHESGHAVGLVQPDMEQYDRISNFAGHCGNSCVMETVNGPRDMRVVVDKILANTVTIGFCGDCHGFMQRAHLA